MKKLRMLTMVLTCTSLLGACSTSGKSSTEKAPSPAMAESSDKMSNAAASSNDQDFQLQAVDGKTYSLSDFKGKKVYIKFWASWCPICLAGLEEIDDLAKDVPEDTVILSVVSPNHKGEQSEADFKNWYKGLDYKHLPVLLDPSGKLIESYGVRVYPTSVFIDQDGKVSKTLPGHLEKEDILKTFETIG